MPLSDAERCEHVDWIFKASDECSLEGLSPHALTLAITYFDRYCAEEGPACVSMRASAAACVCIAAKFVESSCPSFRALTDQCAFGQQQLNVSQIEDAGE
mmetsp:Transcript_17267/g.56661  ORF Transcript_17267/g.56661 Transcript_17267/m.56661 type:complete len:100 (-) Transcript_17267:330-629(-)